MLRFVKRYREDVVTDQKSKSSAEVHKKARRYQVPDKWAMRSTSVSRVFRRRGKGEGEEEFPSKARMR